MACGLVFGLINGLLIAFIRLPPFIVTLGTLTADSRRRAADRARYDRLQFRFALRHDRQWLDFRRPLARRHRTRRRGPFLADPATDGARNMDLCDRRQRGGGAPRWHQGAARAAVRLWRSGFLAGLGGAMSAARLLAANGLQLGQSYELDAIAAVILGGTSFVGGVGSIWGTLIGGLIIAVLSTGSSGRRLGRLAVHYQGSGDRRSPSPSTAFGCARAREAELKINLKKSPARRSVGRSRRGRWRKQDENLCAAHVRGGPRRFDAGIGIGRKLDKVEFGRARSATRSSWP